MLFGWQGALLSIAVPAVLLTVAWAWYGRDTPTQHWKVQPDELADLEASDLERPARMTLVRMRAILA